MPINQAIRFPKVCTGVWLSLVERLVWDQEAAGSNPVTPTQVTPKQNSRSAGVVQW
jgi:hypothetical protein